MEDKDSTYILTGEAAKDRSLTEKVFLKDPRRGVRHYLAYVAHPRGEIAVMDAVRIVQDVPHGYLVQDATDEERIALERKYSQKTPQRDGQAFDVAQRVSQRF